MNMCTVYTYIYIYIWPNFVKEECFTNLRPPPQQAKKQTTTNYYKLLYARMRCGIVFSLCLWYDLLGKNNTKRTQDERARLFRDGTTTSQVAGWGYRPAPRKVSFIFEGKISGLNPLLGSHVVFPIQQPSEIGRKRTHKGTAQLRAWIFPAGSQGTNAIQLHEQTSRILGGS